MSGPVFMYRKGEARLFASPEEVPAGEGWVDSPVLDAEDTALEPAPEAAPEVAPVADEAATELDALRARAAALGIEVDGRWGVKKLRLMIEAVEANGDSE